MKRKICQNGKGIEKMKPKRWIAGLLAGLMTLLCTGCGNANPSGSGIEQPISSQPPIASESTQQNPAAPISATALRQPALAAAKELPAFDWEADHTAQEGVCRAINTFAFDLSSTLLEADAQRNLICSPLSVYFTLGALLNGADEAGQREILEMTGLSAEGLTVQQANEGFAELLYQLTHSPASFEPYSPLSIANAVFVDDDYTLQTAFAQAVRDSLRAEAFGVDFADPTAVDAINNWCNEHTEGLIEEIVQEISPDTVAAIANAIYFSDRWSREFRPEDNETLPFYGQTVETQGTFMVRDGTRIPYYEDDRLQAVNLAFRNGGGLMVLLPKDGDAVSLLAQTDAADFAALRTSLEPKTGVVKLPRFTMDYDTELKDALSALGFGPMFDENEALFNAMVKESPLFVSQGLHKATITVEETGTTAAAVTVMMAEATAMPMDDPSQPFEMICDRPFAFVLYANTYPNDPVVLFTGVLQDLDA